MSSRMKRFILLALTIILTALLMSCNAELRAQRLISKARKLDPTAFEINRDTLTRIDTLEVVKIDTAFKQAKDSLIYITKYDTVTNDSVRIKYYWNTKLDTVFLEVDCPDCKEKSTTITEKETVFIEPTFWQKAQFAIPFIIFALLSIFLTIIRKRKS